MTLVNDYASLLRVSPVGLFPFSGLDKIVNWGAALKQAGTSAFAPLLLVAGALVEFITPRLLRHGLARPTGSLRAGRVLRRDGNRLSPVLDL